MKKRILSLALALVFCLSLVPGVTLTAKAADYDIYVAGVRVTSDNAADILGDGTASYDDSTHTLTLNNCTINGDGDGTINSLISYEMNLTIKLEGQNALICGASQNNGIAWGDAGTNLTITGSGSLVVSGGSRANTELKAISASNLTFDEDFTGTLIVTGGSATGGYGSNGIYAQNTLTVKNGTIIASGGPAEKSRGVYVENSSMTVSGGVLIAQGGNATSQSYGVWSRGVNISDSAAVVMRAGLVNGELSGTRQACSATPQVSNMISYNNGNYGQVIIPNGWETHTDSSTSYNLSSLSKDTIIYRTVAGGVTTDATTIDTKGKTLLCVNLYEGTEDNTHGLTLTADNVSITGGGKVIAVSGITTYLYGFSNGLAPMGDSYGLYCAKLTVEDTEIVGVGGPSNYESVGVYPRGGAEISGAGKITGVGGPSFGVSSISSGGPSIGICTYGENPTSLSEQAQILGVGGYSISENSTGFSGGTCTVPVGTSMLCVGGIAAKDSHGAVAVGGGTVSGAFAALGGKAGQRSVGARIDQPFTVNDGARVSVLAGDSSSSYGFRGYSDYADVIVNGGDFRAAGRTAAFNNIAGDPSVEVGSGVTLMSYSDYAGTEGAANFTGGYMESISAKCVKTAVEKYPLYIAGTQVTGDNATDILGDGKVSYDATTNTLTLNGVTIDGGSENTNNYGWGINYRGTNDFYIVANGTNTVADNSYRTYASYGIVIGEPSPLVHSTAAVNVTITVSDEASLTVSGGNINQSEDYSGSWGIYNKGTGSLIINGSGVLIAEAKDNSRKSIGIVAQNVTIDSSCSVTAAGGNSGNSMSAGIYCGNLNVPQSFTGSVTATAGNALGASYSTGTFGIRTTGDCAIGGGSVTASTGNMTGSGTSGDYGVGIFGENSLSISGGAIVNATGDGCGLWCYQGTVSIDASTVTAAGGNMATNGLNLTNVTAVGSASVDGTDPTEYDNSVYTTYKYVKTTPSQTFYTVSFHPGEGTGTMADVETVGNYTLPASTFTAPDGKTFDQWSIDGVNYAAGAVYTVEKDTNVIATWKDAPAPSSGGGSGPAIYPIAAPVAENGTVTVSPAAASKGTTVTVTPKPDEGYEVDKVTVTDKDGNEIPVTDNGDGTYSFTMPSGKVTVNATFKEIDHNAICPSKDFKDVDPDVWYHEAVDYVVEKGLMVGIADDQFNPNGTTTRAMIVTILYRLEGKPAVSGENPFDDVVADEWYTDAVIWASENDIVSGYGGGKFGPMDDITREQFATILYRYAQYKGYDVSVGEDTNVLSYNDAFDVSEWAMPAIQWACGAELMQGDDLGNLLPGDSATRAQAAALIMRFVENVK